MLGGDDRNADRRDSIFGPLFGKARPPLAKQRKRSHDIGDVRIPQFDPGSRRRRRGDKTKHHVGGRREEFFPAGRVSGKEHFGRGEVPKKTTEDCGLGVF